MRVSFKQHAIAFAVAAAFQPSLFAQTLPAGGTVAAGQATISSSPGSMQIHQTTDKAILNWQSFSIGAGGQVNFSQPSASSVALNRVLGNNPSQIWGSLSANGQVFLVNPSGILFAPGASVSTGGLVASTLSIADQDFLAGVYRFVNDGAAGSVVNQGVISGGYTALLGPQVTNEGLIFAHMGNIALAAGDRVSLDLVGDGLIRVSVDQAALNASVVNRGSLEVHGGQILLAAKSANALLDTVINTDGFVRAVSMVERNGEVVLDGGPRGTVAIGGTIFADGTFSATAGGDMTASGFAQGAGQSLTAGGDLTISGFVTSTAGQTVTARSLLVSAQSGNGAALSSFGGDQAITIAGGAGIDVIAGNGGFASISHDGGGTQRILVTDAEHINVDGAGGGAGIFAFNSEQIVSITGSGANAITLGSAGALGPSNLGGGVEQEITAGLAGQAGSIRIVGSDANSALAGIVSNPSLGGTQTISTSGELSVTGGSAVFQHPNFPAGIFHNGSGAQEITAHSIDIRAGATGTGNGAFVNSNGGGDQIVTVTGGSIRVAAGEGGSGNGASLGSARGRNQTISGWLDIFISGGASSNASVQAGLGFAQDITARNIFLTNAENSPGNSAGVILGSHQLIDASGDVTLIARSGTGTASGVRIGAAGGNPTDLTLRVSGDVRLTGGTTGTNGAALGGAGTVPTGANDIVVNATGDVVLDGAAGGGGARIGSSALTPMQEGDISVTARNILFTGSAPAAIRTAGNVELRAGEITQDANGRILANALTTESSGSARLEGMNNVSSFSGFAGGDLLLRNLSAFLTLGPVSASGALAIDQAGSLLIQATDAPLVVRGGLVNVIAGGDFQLVGGAADGAEALLLSGADINLAVGGALRLDEGAGKFAAARIEAGKGSVINLAGDFFVNGVEGDPRDGKTGFFIFHKPAKIGRVLILE